MQEACTWEPRAPYIVFCLRRPVVSEQLPLPSLCMVSHAAPAMKLKERTVRSIRLLKSRCVDLQNRLYPFISLSLHVVYCGDVSDIVSSHISRVKNVKTNDTKMAIKIRHDQKINLRAWVLLSTNDKKLISREATNGILIFNGYIINQRDLQHRHKFKKFARK